MSAVNVIIETRAGEVQDVLSDSPVNLAFIDRESIDADAPNYMASVLGGPAMVSATYEATVVADDIHAHWKQMQAMDLPEETGMYAADVDADEVVKVLED